MKSQGMQVVKSFVAEVKTVWSAHWGHKHFKAHLLFSFLIFSFVLYYSCLFLSMWETRKGYIFIDPLLNRLQPREFSFQIFTIVHSSLLITLVLFLADPRKLMKGLQAYAVLLSLRTLTIYLFPLERPQGMIFLEDPITGFFLNSVHVVTKDLFFSGHVSAMCLFLYFTENKIWKTYLMIATPVLALLIMWQHVHYSIDVMAAPVFAFLSCKWIDKIHERWEYGIDNLQPENWQLHQEIN